MNDSVGGYTFRTRLNYALPQLAKGLGIQLRWDETKAAATPAKDLVNPDFDAEGTKLYVDYSMGAAYIGYSATLDTLDDPGAIFLGYDFGVAKVDLALTNYDHTEVAITAPLGAQLSAGLHVQMGDVADAVGARLTYAMSKRTNVSFNYVDVSETTSTKIGAGTNYRVRVSHSF
jgi:hypothetical protein